MSRLTSLLLHHTRVTIKADRIVSSKLRMQNRSIDLTAERLWERLLFYPHNPHDMKLMQRGSI